MTGGEPQPWALVLGASSGMGAACCRAFARQGMGILGVHLDRRSTLPAVEALAAELGAFGVPVHLFNANAADDGARTQVLSAITQGVGAGRVQVLVHSLAFGTLGPLLPTEGRRAVTRKQVEMTLDVMCTSLLYWVQDLVQADLLARGGRIFALTSAGSHRVWPDYGPVAMAKAALEALVRQLAWELAPRGVTVNAIQAGATPTPALARIPGHQELLERVRAQSPHHRNATPEDVAACLVELARSGTHWVTGSVIHVDGGEDFFG